MKIIIAGDGKVGSTLTRELAAEGYDVTIIDANPKVLEATEERYDVLSIQGNCASMDVLDQAGVREADLLIVATSADEINLLCSLTAHCMNKDIHTIARIRNPEYTNQLVRMRDAFALSMTVNPELQAAVEIERLIKYPGFLKRDTFAKGRVEIVELRVIKESPLCDLCLNDLEQVVKCQVLVCTVLRRGEAVAPDGNFVLREGDRIFVTAPSENLTILLKNLGIITHKARRVMICGGGRVSYYLASRLIAMGIQVKIIEIQEDKCEHLCELLPKATIINGDATDHDLLVEEGIANTDAFIALTGMDEENIIMSLFARSQNVSKVIVKINEDRRAAMIRDFGLNSLVSPKSAVANSIWQYVRARKNSQSSANVETLYQLVGGKIEALEFIVKSSAAYTGIPLKDLAIKPNNLIACIARRRKIIIPNGNDSIQVGDSVIVVTKDKRIQDLKDILREG